MTDFEKIKQSLFDERKGIVNKHNTLIKDIDAISNSTLDSRLTRAGFLSVLTYFGGVLALPQILNTGISPNLIAPALLTSSIAVGTIGESLYTKIRGYKNELRRISTFYTQRDYIAQETRCEIAHAKCHAVMDLIDKAYSNIQSEEKMNAFLTPMTELNEANMNILPTTELERRIAQLENLYKDKINEIDIAVAQVTLIDQFKRTRTKTIFDTIFKGFYSFIGGMCAGLAVSGMPNMYLYNRSLIETQADPNTMFAVSLATGAVCLGYSIKRNRNYKSVFNALNEQLLLDKISSRQSPFDSGYRDTLNNLINDAAVIRLELEKTKRQLESLTTYAEVETTEQASEDIEQTPKTLNKTKQAKN